MNNLSTLLGWIEKLLLFCNGVMISIVSMQNYMCCAKPICLQGSLPFRILEGYLQDPARILVHDSTSCWDPYFQGSFKDLCRILSESWLMS